MMRVLLLAVWGLYWSATIASAQTSPTVDEFRRLEDRITRLELELSRQKARNPEMSSTAPASRKLILMMESPHLGQIYVGGPTATRFFVAKLLAVNMDSKPLVIKRDNVKLAIDGQANPIQEVPSDMRYHGFQLGRQHVQMESVSSFKELRVPAGGTNSGWIFIKDMPQGTRVPRLSLEVTHTGGVEKLDVNAQQRALLGLEVQYIGPRNCLALLTISGELNMINLGAIVDELDGLAARKVGRAVIAWTDSATMLPVDLQNWLQQVANALGAHEVVNELFPTLPATLREFHLASLPQRDGSEEMLVDESEIATVTRRIHKTPADAVRAALKTACESLPREELLGAIEQGHPWARAAMLAYGAGRLPAGQLALVIKYTDDADPAIQAAALHGLRHFGEAAAIERLVLYVRKNQPELSPIAVSSLASSRFPAANQALLDILKTEPPSSKQAIVKILANFPRPIWSDVLYEFAKDPQSGLTTEALAALNSVGHPQLVPLLKDKLQGTDPIARQQAFEILVGRRDPVADRAAMEFTLEQLKSAPPTQLMINLLLRVKDQRAVPLVLAQLSRTEDKTSLIDLLLKIGDQSLPQQILPLYDSLPSNARALLLLAARKWEPEKFQKLAGDALGQSDITLLNAAVQGLIEDGSPEAVRMLADALEKNPEPQTWHYLCSALAQLGTDTARSALLKARDGNNATKQICADQGLRQLRQRSPGQVNLYQGMQELKEKRYKEAISQFDQAIQKDPQLPEAYIGRADCYNRLKQMVDARKDYEKALELDPFNGQAATGVSITRIIEGDIGPALEILEARRERLQGDSLFLYNAACAYSRAVEYLEAHPETANRDQLMPQYRQRALDDLQKSIQQGFADFDWMKEDPDLKALHSESRFQQFLEKKGVPAEEGRVG